jgi:hypothetical protein
LKWFTPVRSSSFPDGVLVLPVNVDLSIADLAFTMEFGRAEVVIAT